MVKTMFDHWLMRPTVNPRSEGSTVTGAGGGQRVNDPSYIRSLFEDAPTEALIAAKDVIEKLLH